MAGTWKKSPPELVERFDDLVAMVPMSERRQMFGYPCAFVGGNMFMGLHEDRLVLRLPDADRDRIMARYGAEPFQPMPGRAMKEYVVVPAALLADDDTLAVWVHRAYAYAAHLPPKRKGKDGE
jgi:TfoX/Sxy family transcriptional regulator of competence genes